MRRLAMVAMLALGGGLVVSLDSTASLAAKPPSKTPAESSSEGNVATLAPFLDGFKWGSTHVDVVRAYNQTGGIFDKDYNASLMKMQPGVQMQAAEAERESRKATFEHSFIEFKNTPTGYDSTGLRGEYTYRNHESVLRLERDGKNRYFFFIGAPPGDRLWKIYDEVPLREGGPLGATFESAVSKLNASAGAKGRIRAADAAQAIRFPTAEWQDGTTHMRAIDRSREHVVAIALEDRATLSALPQLRGNKAEDPLAMDPAVTAITNGGVSDPNAHAAPSSSAAQPKKNSKK